MPSGATKQVDLHQVTPGVWRASLPVTEPGIHRLSDGKLTAAVAIGSADPKETADPVATDAKLAPAAKASGGGLYWLEDYSSPAAHRQSRRRPPDGGLRLAWLQGQ